MVTLTQFDKTILQYPRNKKYFIILNCRVSHLSSQLLFFVWKVWGNNDTTHMCTYIGTKYARKTDDPTVYSRYNKACVFRASRQQTSKIGEFST